MFIESTTLRTSGKAELMNCSCSQCRPNWTKDSTHLSALIQFFGGEPVAFIQVEDSIGSEDNAILAASFFKNNVQNWGLPEGWTTLGEGMSRRVYLGPDNVAYKVLMNDRYARVGSNANESEAMAYAALKDHMPSHIRLAKCFVWPNSVSAMEYVPGGHGEGFGEYVNVVSELIRIASDHGFTIRDLHPGNVRFSNGILYAIDYAL